MPDITTFDQKAKTYDEAFTHSYVGSIQRKRIHEFVGSQLEGKSGLEILELNCGTGADIPFLSQYGTVTATDVSLEMLRIAQSKNPGAGFGLLDLNQPIPGDKKYDLIFSNFGGFNCISPERWQQLDHELSGILNPSGMLILVVMHPWSYVEFLYFLLRFNFKKAFRRLSGKASFNGMDIYYYSSPRIRSMFSHFKLNDTKRVGVLLAGEYMNGIGKAFRLKDKNHWLFPFWGADHKVYVMRKK